MPISDEWTLLKRKPKGDLDKIMRSPGRTGARLLQQRQRHALAPVPGPLDRIYQIGVEALPGSGKQEIPPRIRELQQGIELVR